ncbi:hypothetical protein EMPS_02196 [Entomortierella parvispora]|uniref:Septin-type G domain-containing protein n=1 Tax=Entomortierella parvispora TaxID=205924 RepID=A0A9P3LTH7_9FUNG|nr:hypothetical protein EMPS_02196 [Entomortierella parvispora]
MTAPHYLLANPFAGQNIGHLRLAVVGDSGVGKTMFARQFVETLPEVLRHDWEDQPKASGNNDNSNAYQDDEDEDYVRTEALIEKSASTMMEIPWDNMDTDDEVPARNLIFVDTPGYGSVADARLNFELFLSHMGQSFEEKNQRISPFTEVSNNELMRSLVTGVGAHRFVDVCFYLIVHRLKPIDIEYMRMISEKANVVPIIAKVDTQSQQEVYQLKASILRTLRDQGVPIYTFRIDYERLIQMAESGQPGGPPFAVSNKIPSPLSSTSVDNQDPEDRISFVPCENELPMMRKLVLETQITNIRQFTVKKFINWRGKQGPTQHEQQPSGGSSSRDLHQMQRIVVHS